MRYYRDNSVLTGRYPEELQELKLLLLLLLLLLLFIIVFMQVIHMYIPETNHVSAILYLQFMAYASIATSFVTSFVLLLSTFRSVCVCSAQYGCFL